MNTAANDTKKTKSKGKLAFNIVFYIICVAIFVVMMYILITVSSANKKGELPRVFGWSLHYVVTDSMEPEIMTGDLIWAKTVSYDELVPEEDTVVFFNPNLGVYIVHKLRDKELTEDGASYTTYGVNPKYHGASDSYHPTIVSKVEGSSAFMGKCVAIVKTPLYAAIIVVIVIILLFLPSLIKAIVKYLSKTTEQE